MFKFGGQGVAVKIQTSVCWFSHISFKGQSFFNQCLQASYNDMQRHLMFLLFLQSSSENYWKYNFPVQSLGVRQNCHFNFSLERKGKPSLYVQVSSVWNKVTMKATPVMKQLSLMSLGPRVVLKAELEPWYSIFDMKFRKCKSFNMYNSISFCITIYFRK